MSGDFPVDDEPREWDAHAMSRFYREFREHRKEFVDHRTKAEERMDEAHAFFSQGFPDHARDEKDFQRSVASAFGIDRHGNPDFVGHRMTHEAQTRAAEAQTKFWTDLTSEIAKKGTIGVLVIVVGLLVVGAAAKLGIKP